MFEPDENNPFQVNQEEPPIVTSRRQPAYRVYFQEAVFGCDDPENVMMRVFTHMAMIVRREIELPGMPADPVPVLPWSPEEVFSMIKPTAEYIAKESDLINRRLAILQTQDSGYLLQSLDKELEDHRETLYSAEFWKRIDRIKYRRSVGKAPVKRRSTNCLTDGPRPDEMEDREWAERRHIKRRRIERRDETFTEWRERRRLSMHQNDRVEDYPARNRRRNNRNQESMQNIEMDVAVTEYEQASALAAQVVQEMEGTLAALDGLKIWLEMESVEKCTVSPEVDEHPSLKPEESHPAPPRKKYKLSSDQHMYETDDPKDEFLKLFELVSEVAQDQEGKESNPEEPAPSAIWEMWGKLLKMDKESGEYKEKVAWITDRHAKSLVRRAEQANKLRHLIDDVSSVGMLVGNFFSNSEHEQRIRPNSLREKRTIYHAIEVDPTADSDAATQNGGSGSGPKAESGEGSEKPSNSGDADAESDESMLEAVRDAARKAFGADDLSQRTKSPVQPKVVEITDEEPVKGADKPAEHSPKVVEVTDEEAADFEKADDADKPEPVIDEEAGEDEATDLEKPSGLMKRQQMMVIVMCNQAKDVPRMRTILMIS
ncbi:unnamed protein product, partial [Mesorhabditis spiculigera]